MTTTAATTPERTYARIIETHELDESTIATVRYFGQTYTLISTASGTDLLVEPNGSMGELRPPEGPSRSRQELKHAAIASAVCQHYA